MNNYDIIISGAGGQGVMFIGKMLAKLAVDAYPHVTFIPSYGAEVRGGTSNCQVRLSQEPIATPLVEKATLLVLANQPSVDRFMPMLAEGGTAFVNSSMASAASVGQASGLSSEAVKATGGTHAGKLPVVLEIPATQTALEIGDVQATNVVLLAALLARTGIIDRAARWTRWSRPPHAKATARSSSTARRSKKAGRWETGSSQ